MRSTITKTSSIKKRLRLEQFKAFLATHEKEEEEREARRKKVFEEYSLSMKRLRADMDSIFAEMEGLDEEDSVNKGGFPLVQSASEVPIDSPPEQEEILKEGVCEQDEKASETVPVFTEEGDMKAFLEQFEASFKDYEDELDTVQEVQVHKPKRLSTDLLLKEDEMRQLTTGLRAGISSPSVDDDEFFGGASQDVASLGEIRAHKALEDKRGRNG